MKTKVELYTLLEIFCKGETYVYLHKKNKEMLFGWILGSQFDRILFRKRLFGKKHRREEIKNFVVLIKDICDCGTVR